MNRSRWLWLLVPVMAVAGATSCVVETTDDCISGDTFCETDRHLNYCDDTTGDYIVANCDVSCTTDDRVYGNTCGGPAAWGTCGSLDGADLCLCYCQDAFQGCLDDDFIQYLDDKGDVFQTSCGDYCGGFCEPDLGACAC